MTRKYKIAALPGMGSGKETVPEGMRVLDAAAARFGFALEYTRIMIGLARPTKRRAR